jgi:hypothetical protein
MTRIEVNLSSLREIKPHEYAVRFAFGGLSTVAAGLIAKRFGPGLMGFAFVLWRWLNSHNALLMIFSAAVIWLIIAYGLWVVRAKRPHALR